MDVLQKEFTRYKLYARIRVAENKHTKRHRKKKYRRAGAISSVVKIFESRALKFTGEATEPRFGQRTSVSHFDQYCLSCENTRVDIYDTVYCGEYNFPRLIRFFFF